MGKIQDRIQKVQGLITKAEAHCMCLYFTETPTHYMVQYPDGYYPGAVRVEIDGNKAKALERLISTMDKHWDES